MIKAQNLKFRYRGAHENALNGVSLTVKTGECVALVGKNGSGKSTLGRILAGLTRFRVGEVTIDGHKPSNQPIGIVFQNPENQIIFSDIRDELSFALQTFSPSEIDSRIDSALRQVDMLEFKKRNLYELSLGQKQRIMIAEALAINAKYLILDEPTTMIDSAGKDKIHTIIRDLKNQGCTILLLTNAADEILLADRTLVLESGRIIAEIPRSRLLDQADFLRQHGLVLPTILQIAEALQKSNIDLELKVFTITELSHTLINKIHHD